MTASIVFCIRNFFLSTLLISPFAFAAPVVQEFMYSPDQVYQINTGLGIATQIEINSQEDVKAFGTGFSNGWDLSRRDNVFYLKPKDVDVDTNMYIKTSAHSYLFELKVVGKQWKTLDEAKDKGVFYKVKFNYPESTVFTEDVKSSESQMTATLKGYSYYTDYDFSTNAQGSWLVPSRVYDDGKFTYAQLSDSVYTANFPNVYAKKEQSGEEFLVNISVEKNTIVVHGVYPYLVLRHGGNVVGLRRN